MYKQKVRLLNQVKNIYREERRVHYLVKEFDPTSKNFVQTCQMEVVRQELIKERLVPDWATMFPERFNKKTNGVTQRR